eukprot:1487936-Amphidinium_carterae.1
MALAHDTHFAVIDPINAAHRKESGWIGSTQTKQIGSGAAIHCGTKDRVSMGADTTRPRIMLVSPARVQGRKMVPLASHVKAFCAFLSAAT